MHYETHLMAAASLRMSCRTASLLAPLMMTLTDTRGPKGTCTAIVKVDVGRPAGVRAARSM